MGAQGGSPRTPPYHTMPCHTIPYHTIPYHTMPYHTIPYQTIPYHTIPYHTMPYHTKPYHTIPYHTIPYHTIPYHAIPYHTTPYHTLRSRKSPRTSPGFQRRCVCGPCRCACHSRRLHPSYAKLYRSSPIPTPSSHLYLQVGRQSQITSRPFCFKMAQNLDLRCVLVRAPWVLGPKHVSNPE